MLLKYAKSCHMQTNSRLVLVGQPQEAAEWVARGACTAHPIHIQMCQASEWAGMGVCFSRIHCLGC